MTFMHTTTDTNHRTIWDALADPARRVTRRGDGSPLSPYTQIIGVGSTELYLVLGQDHNWRLTSIYTYGNRNRVTGPGVDATGYVVQDFRLAVELDDLWHA